MSPSFLARYYVSRFLLSLALWVMPRGRYRDELLMAMHDLKAKCIWTVTRHRAGLET